MKRMLLLLLFVPVIGFAEVDHWYCASEHGDPFLLSIDTSSNTVTEVQDKLKWTHNIGHIDGPILMWVVSLDRFNHLMDDFSLKKTDFGTFVFNRTTGKWTGHFVVTFGDESKKLTLFASCHEAP